VDAKEARGTGAPPPDRQPASPVAAAPVVPVVRMPAEKGGVALATLAVIGVVLMLQWAQAFVISLLMGILIAYTLNPPVAWLERLRIPRVVAALIVMLSVLGTLAFGAYSLRGQMQAIIEQLPETAAKFSAGLARLEISQVGTLQKMRNAAAEMETAAAPAPGEPSVPRQSATHVVIDQPMFKLGDFLWVGSKGALGGLGQAIMVLFLSLFLLAGGNTFKRKLVRLSGPSLSNKKITVQVLDDINHSIQKYLFMMLLTNALIGLLVWGAFAWIGLNNAGAWAVAAGLLHVIPYLGPAVTAVATGMAAFMQFDSFPMALLVSGSWLAISTLIDTVVTTWMTMRIAKMNAAAVFISLLFWGWLWGVWGMLLSIPIVVIVKVVSQHVEQLQPVAEMLGE